MLAHKSSAAFQHILGLGKLDEVFLGVEMQVQVACDDFLARGYVLKQAKHGLVISFESASTVDCAQVVEIDKLSVQ